MYGSVGCFGQEYVRACILHNTSSVSLMRATFSRWRRLSISCAFVINRIVPCALCACHPRTECSARSEGSAHGGSEKFDFRYAKVTFLKRHTLGRAVGSCADPSLYFVSFEDDSAGSVSAFWIVEDAGPHGECLLPP